MEENGYCHLTNYQRRRLNVVGKGRRIEFIRAGLERARYFANKTIF